MSKTNPPYPQEFRQQLIELVHVGRSPEDERNKRWLR